MIQAHQLSRHFGPITAVRNATFHVPRGSLAAFLGPNGAGKTTTIRLLSGFLAPSSGSASIDGLDTVRDSLAARARLGLLHEHNPLYPEMRVRDYLIHRAALHRVPRADRSSATDRAVERCQLRDVARRRIGALSKGYRQRVGLAAAILHDPPALILDEPTSGLDPAQMQDTRALLRDLAHDHAVLLSSHILPEVERLCDRVIIIAGGTIRADDTPANLLASHSHDAPYSLQCEAGHAQLLASSLSGVPGVTSVAPPAIVGDGWSVIVVTPKRDAPDLRASLARAAQGANVLVREIRRASPTLETVFGASIAARGGSDA